MRQTRQPKPPLSSRQRTIADFAEATGVDPQVLALGVDLYLKDFSAYGNEIYDDIATRLAHWISFQEQGWFQRRLDRAFLAMQNADAIVDLGFSVPYAYTNRLVREDLSKRFILVDRTRSALDFYDAITRMNRWQRRCSLDRTILADIEAPLGKQRILAAVDSLKPTSLLIIASEVVEHLTDDSQLWEIVLALESVPSVRRCECFITLPIGRRIPSHTIEFRTSDAALGYLRRQMVTCQSFLLQPALKAETNKFLSACLCATGRVSRGDLLSVL